MSDFWTTKVAWFKSSVFEAHPIYHRHLMWSDKKVDGPIYTMTTACGIVTRRWNKDTGDSERMSGFFIRRDYADLFARPCRHCWPASTTAADAASKEEPSDV